MDEFCGQKRIKKEYSVARTPQQNGVAERKNRTLIEVARTMLADSLLPTVFWAKAVNTACYVLNRVLVTKPHNKTPYELIIGRAPSISFMRPFGCPVTILNTLDPLGKFDGKAEEEFLVGYSVNSKAFRSQWTIICSFGGSLPIDVSNLPHDPLMPELEDTAKIRTQISRIQSQHTTMALQRRITGEHAVVSYILNMVLKQCKRKLLQFKDSEGLDTSSNNLGGKKADCTKWVYKIRKDERRIVVKNKARLDSTTIEMTIIFGLTKKSLCDDFEQIMHNRTASTPMETNKALTKDEDGEDVDVYLYRSMIGSLMYLTSSRPDIMFSDCACSRFQVLPKVSHLNAVKRIFRYLKGQPKLGLWYPKDSPLTLEAFLDSDYAGASLDKKSTTRGCQFLGSKLISWQCKKQTVVANSTTKAEYIAASHCSRQVFTLHHTTTCHGKRGQDTKIPQSGSPPIKVRDKEESAVHKGFGDGYRWKGLPLLLLALK
ncbi:putative ribonuclease H-like domain-containing protein [Tanacetum coccineum]|uniref:Ribonuclease H-like domain-containing protein n=1 Tax=Tanacetum coccineum TaxID=301880 RepID=A0ABQ5AKF9_9ASTR